MITNAFFLQESKKAHKARNRKIKISECEWKSQRVFETNILSINWKSGYREGKKWKLLILQIKAGKTVNMVWIRSHLKSPMDCYDEIKTHINDFRFICKNPVDLRPFANYNGNMWNLVTEDNNLTDSSRFVSFFRVEGRTFKSNKFSLYTWNQILLLQQQIYHTHERMFIIICLVEPDIQSSRYGFVIPSIFHILQFVFNSRTFDIMTGLQPWPMLWSIQKFSRNICEEGFAHNGVCIAHTRF